MSPEEKKKNACLLALDYVRPGMNLGLGTGSTANIFIELLAEQVKHGLEVVCVPTSVASHDLAHSLGIALTTLEQSPQLDLTVDGADEFDNDLVLIKGGGGALLREKIVATASKTMVVITDDSKQVEVLGKFPLPIEVIPFGEASTLIAIKRVAGKLRMQGAVELRKRDDATPFITDSGNHIYDCRFNALKTPGQLATALNAIAGVVEHGLFIDIASAILIGDNKGAHVVER